MRAQAPHDGDFGLAVCESGCAALSANGPLGPSLEESSSCRSVAGSDPGAPYKNGVVDGFPSKLIFCIGVDKTGA